MILTQRVHLTAGISEASIHQRWPMNHLSNKRLKGEWESVRYTILILRDENKWIMCEWWDDILSIISAIDMIVVLHKKLCLRINIVKEGKCIRFEGLGKRIMELS